MRRPRAERRQAQAAGKRGAAARRRSLARPGVVFAAILIAAIVIRVVMLAQISTSKLGGELSIDSEFYRELAIDIQMGMGLPEGALTFNPLYPFFLAAVFRVFGEGMLAPRIVQALLGILTIVLVYVAGTRLVEDPMTGKSRWNATALVAMAMAALYPQFVLYEGMLLGTTLEIFFLTASFALALAMDDDLRGGRELRVGRRRMPVWLSGGLLGAMCGAGSLGRPNLFLPLVAALPVWIIARNPRGRRWLAPAVGFAAFAALFLLPPTIYNAKYSGEFVPVTAHGGINFYIGNRIGTLGVYQPPEDMRGEMRGLIADARAKAEKETGRSMTDAETSDYYMQKALDEIKHNPGGWLLLLGRKLVLFWNKIEVQDMPEVLYFQNTLPLFKFPFLPFSVIAPLGLAGLVVFLRRRRNRSIVCLFLGTAMISVLLFYANSRYRLPIVPVVILLAAFFVAWAVREIAARRMKYPGLMIALALVVFFGVSNRTIMKPNLGAIYTFLGNRYMNSGDEAKAAEAYAQAYRLDPTRDVSMINYARILLKNEEFAKAAAIYAKAYSINPRYPRLAIEYASALDGMGKRDEAKKLYLEAYSSGPPDDKVLACKALAQIVFFEGKKDEAMKWVETGLGLAPDDAILKQMLDALKSAP
jgi:tetratricopeptide (TPR) repeat protein